MTSTGTGERREAFGIFETVLAVGLSRARYEIHVTDSARAADIRFLAYRDFTAGVKFDSKASWIFTKDP